MALGMIRSSLAHLQTPHTHLQNCIPVPTPSFPLSRPLCVSRQPLLPPFLILIFTVIRFSGYFNKTCVLWIKCIVIFFFITALNPLETIIQISLYLQDMSAYSTLSFLCFDHYSASAACSAKSRTWGLEANIKTFHPGRLRHTSEPIWYMERLRSWHQLKYHLATHWHTVLSLVWLCAADWWETRKL